MQTPGTTRPLAKPIASTGLISTYVINFMDVCSKRAIPYYCKNNSAAVFKEALGITKQFNSETIQ